MTVTVSVDVDENKDCVTRSGGETGPGRRWSEFWRRTFGLTEAVSRSCTKLSYIGCICRAFLSSSTASFQYGCVMTLHMNHNALQMAMMFSSFSADSMILSVMQWAFRSCEILY
jgi:hypothetical protein